MLQPAIDVSRNWSSSLSRLGFGLVAVQLLETIAGRTIVSVEDVFAQPITLSTITIALVLLLGSFLVGGIVISVGEMTIRGPYKKLDMTIRAMRIADTRNELLVQRYRDAQSQFEIAAGIFGLFLIIAFLAVAFFISGAIGLVERTATIQVGSANDNRTRVIFGIAGAVFGIAARHSATESLDALDRVLDRFYPLQEPKLAVEERQET